MTSAFVREALDQGARAFNWTERSSQPKDLGGSKRRGIGVGLGYHGAGGRGYDGLLRIGTDGRLYIHSGVGNLGTYSYAATCRAAAEALQIPWERCEIVRGRSDRYLPHSSGQGGSNTIFTHTRTNWVAAQDAIAKMKEIAAMDLGGTADDYEIGDERVFKTADNSQGLTYAEAARRAMELGGKFSGEEYPDDINPLTQIAVQGMAGSGLVGVAKDNIPGVGQPPGNVIGFMEIELDIDTGKYEIVDYASVADCGTVVHPKNFENAMRGGAVWGSDYPVSRSMSMIRKTGFRPTPGCISASRQLTWTFLSIQSLKVSTSRIRKIQQEVAGSANLHRAPPQRPCQVRCVMRWADTCSTRPR